MTLDLPAQLDAYLALRVALGLPTHATRLLLQQFVGYLDHHHPGAAPIRTQSVIAWACGGTPPRSAAAQTTRLSVARGFLRHLRASAPETEIPDRHLLAAPRRPPPFLFSAPDLGRLLAAAATLRPHGSLRPQTYGTVFGVLAATGLRVSEALSLQCADVHLTDPPPRLLIQRTKFGKTRWVPVHATTAARLRAYAQSRRAQHVAGLSETFFLSNGGQPLTYGAVHRTFQRLMQRLAITPRPGQRRPTLHALRHYLPCRTMSCTRTPAQYFR